MLKERGIQGQWDRSWGAGVETGVRFSYYKTTSERHHLDD